MCKQWLYNLNYSINLLLSLRVFWRVRRKTILGRSVQVFNVSLEHQSELTLNKCTTFSTGTIPTLQFINIFYWNKRFCKYTYFKLSDWLNMLYHIAKAHPVVVKHIAKPLQSAKMGKTIWWFVCSARSLVKICWQKHDGVFDDSPDIQVHFTYCFTYLCVIVLASCACINNKASSRFRRSMTQPNKHEMQTIHGRKCKCKMRKQTKI